MLGKFWGTSSLSWNPRRVRERERESSDPSPINLLLLSFFTLAVSLSLSSGRHSPSYAYIRRKEHGGFEFIDFDEKMSDLTNSHAAESSISRLAPLEAILFDVDGTLCDSDPMHYYAFREMLLEIGYNNSVPITEEDFIEKVAGKNSEDIANTLFPDWDREKAMKFIDDKEARFRKLASKQLEAIDGLYKLRKWTEDRGLKRAAVTNAPRPNAELMISILGLSDFFQHMVIGSECERAKPFPDPYLKALNLLNASPEHSLVFDDSASGIKAGVAAGMPVVGVMTRNPEKSLKDAGASLLIKDYNDPKLWKALEDLEKAEATLKKADV